MNPYLSTQDNSTVTDSQPKPVQRKYDKRRKSPKSIAAFLGSTMHIRSTC